MLQIPEAAQWLPQNTPAVLEARGALMLPEAARELGLTQTQVVQALARMRGERMELYLNGRAIEVPPGWRISPGETVWLTAHSTAQGLWVLRQHRNEAQAQRALAAAGRFSPTGNPRGAQAPAGASSATSPPASSATATADPRADAAAAATQNRVARAKVVLQARAQGQDARMALAKSTAGGDARPTPGGDVRPAQGSATRTPGAATLAPGQASSTRGQGAAPTVQPSASASVVARSAPTVSSTSSVGAVTAASATPQRGVVPGVDGSRASALVQTVEAQLLAGPRGAAPLVDGVDTAALVRTLAASLASAAAGATDSQSATPPAAHGLAASQALAALRSNAAASAVATPQPLTATSEPVPGAAMASTRPAAAGGGAAPAATPTIRPALVSTEAMLSNPLARSVPPLSAPQSGAASHAAWSASNSPTPAANPATPAATLAPSAQIKPPTASVATTGLPQAMAPAAGLPVGAVPGAAVAPTRPGDALIDAPARASAAQVSAIGQWAALAAQVNPGAQEAIDWRLASPRLRQLAAQPPGMPALLQLFQPEVLAQLLQSPALMQWAQTLLRNRMSMRKADATEVRQALEAAMLPMEARLRSAQVVPKEASAVDLRANLAELLRLLKPSASALVHTARAALDEVEAAQLDLVRAHQQREWQFQCVLPFSDALPARIHLQRQDPQTPDATMPRSSQWWIDLYTEGQTLGQVWMRSGVSPDDAVEMQIWASQAHVANDARARVQDLRDLLAEAGLQLRQFTVIHGQRPDPAAPAAPGNGWLVDTHT